MLNLHAKQQQEKTKNCIVKLTKVISTLREEHLYTKKIKLKFLFNIGKHIAYLAPSAAGSSYRNYKGYNSFVLMAICDAHNRYIYIDIGANGIMGDASIWNQSKVRHMLESNEIKLPRACKLPGSELVAPFLLLGDDAFALSTYLMKPYSHRGLSLEEIEYNYLLSRNRRLIECTFGQTTAKFQVISKPIILEADKAIKVVIAIISLHNWLKTDNINSKNTSYGKHNYSENINSGLGGLNRRYGGRNSRQAEEIRSKFKEYIQEKGLESIISGCEG